MAVSTVEDSPFRHLFISNDSPNDEEISRLTEICCQHDTIIDDLERQIQCLQGQIDQLHEEKERLLKTVKPYKPLLSGLRRMPDETLAHIFVYCLPELNAIMRCSEAPLALGRICRRWRSIAYNTPKLWTSIHIFVPIEREGSEFWPALLDGMKAWLDRSGDLPLNISVAADPGSLEEEDKSVMEGAFTNLTVFIDAIKKYSRRWKSLDLIMPVTRPVTLCTLGPEDLPLLETFVMYHNGTDSSLPLPTLSFLREAPQLRILEISRYPSDDGMPVVPYGQLTELHIHYPFSIAYNPTSSLTRILQTCINLKVCIIRRTRDYNANPPTVQQTSGSVEAPALETFILILADVGVSTPLLLSDFNSVLGIVKAPKLRTLELQTNSQIDMFPAIHGVLSRSSCLLEELIIDNIIDSVTDLNNLLIRCSNLEHLSILCQQDAEPEAGEAILRSMIPVSNIMEGTASEDSNANANTQPSLPVTVICPRLRKLKMWFAFCSYTSTIREFVESRINPTPESGVARLEKLRITSGPTVGRRHLSKTQKKLNTEWAEDVARWKEQGVEVKIDMPGPRRKTRRWSPDRWKRLERDIEMYRSDSEASDLSGTESD
jgi:hypothetical protein